MIGKNSDHPAADSSKWPLPGEEVSAAIALQLGAFAEDALSEQEAIAAAGDARLSPLESLPPAPARR